MFDFADEILKEKGFKKIEETDEIVVYERQQPEFVQVLELGRREDCRCMIQSYQKGVNSDGYNNAVGLTLTEAKLAIIKMEQKGW